MEDLHSSLQDAFAHERVGGRESARDALAGPAQGGFAERDSAHSKKSECPPGSVCELFERQRERGAELGTRDAEAAAGGAKTFGDCAEESTGFADGLVLIYCFSAT